MEEEEDNKEEEEGDNKEEEEDEGARGFRESRVVIGRRGDRSLHLSESEG